MNNDICVASTAFVKKRLTNMIDCLGVAIVAFRSGDIIPCRVLLGKRVKADGYGYWVLPGGRLDDGETPEQAVLRESKEEVNLDVKNVTPVHFAYNQDNPENKHLMLYYTALVDPTNVKVTAPHEFSELRWFHITHMPVEMWANDRNAIQRALEYWGGA